MSKPSKARGYGFAVLLTAGAAGLRALLELIGAPPPFITYFPAILISGWSWGRGPAMLCVGLSALSSGWWVPPEPGLQPNPPDLLNISLFLLTGSILALMSAGFREARNRADAARLRLLRFFESTGDAFMAFDRRWRYVYVNPRAAQFAKHTADEMVGRTIFELFPGIETVPFFEAANKVMQERVPVSIDSYYAPLDMWFENDIYPVDDGIGVFYRDITERRRAADIREDLLRREQAARSELERANRLKDEFLATLSHELRTPLNAITGWATLLAGGRLSKEDCAHAVDTIQRNANAQAHLIDDLLDVSRIISGKLRLEVQTVELAPVLEAALDTIRPAVEAKGLSLQVLLDPGVTVISGDPARLQQIAWNLLSNAIKFTPRGGNVRVALQRVNSHIELTVSDTGIGIPPHLLQRIFDRFAQADSTSTREYHGLGLGLALVRHLVEAHGGTVFAFSEGEGRGATFTVSLPLQAAHEERKTPEDRPDPSVVLLGDEGSDPPLRGVAVLLVEDNADARELLVKMLMRLGASVRSTSTGHEALAEIDREPPDVLLSDIEMPGHDGYWLIRQLRSRLDSSARLRAIALTAYARAEDRARALREGFDNHIAKPVHVAELVAAINRAVAGRPHRGAPRQQEQPSDVVFSDPPG